MMHAQMDDQRLEQALSIASRAAALDPEAAPILRRIADEIARRAPMKRRRIEGHRLPGYGGALAF